MLNANAMECISTVSEVEDPQDRVSLKTNFYAYLFF